MRSSSTSVRNNASSKCSHTDTMKGLVSAPRSCTAAAITSCAKFADAHTFIPSVRWAAMRDSAVEFTPSTIGGRGDGAMNVARSARRVGDHNSSIKSSVSSSTRWRSVIVGGCSTPTARRSADHLVFGAEPAPRPSTHRPLLMCCRVAAALAVMTAMRFAAFATSGPRRMLEVTAASAPSVVKHSGMFGADITWPAR